MSVSQSTAPGVISSTAIRLPFCEPDGILVGIYFLCQGDVVVYVGKSTNAAARIAQHQDKVFDRVWFVPALAEDLDVLERMWIERLKPKYNIAGVPEARKQRALAIAAKAKKRAAFNQQLNERLGIATPQPTPRQQRKALPADYSERVAAATLSPRDAKRVASLQRDLRSGDATTKDSGYRLLLWQKQHGCSQQRDEIIGRIQESKGT